MNSIRQANAAANCWLGASKHRLYGVMAASCIVTSVMTWAALRPLIA